MSNHIQPNNSQLITELSEPEQEIVTGGTGTSLPWEGYDFVIQKTEIFTFGMSELDFMKGDLSAASKHRTGYALSETTVGINLPSEDSGRSRRGIITALLGALF